MRRVCVGEDACSRSEALIGEAEVDLVRGQEADAAVSMLAVVSRRKGRSEHGCAARSQAPGKEGPVFSVLNCASEKGLSFETLGLEWLCVTPRSE